MSLSLAACGSSGTAAPAASGSTAASASGSTASSSGYKVAMIAKSADVFFGDASAVDSGARQAIDTANGSGEIKIFDIGQPADLLGQNPCVVCSVVTDNAGMPVTCIPSSFPKPSYGS